MTRIRLLPILLTLALGCGGDDGNGGTTDPPANQPPTVTLTVTPTSGQAPLTSQISVTCSDSDGSISEYRLDADGQSGFEVTQAGAINVSRTFSSTTTVRAQCVDDDGATSTTVSQQVTVTQNQTPTASLTVDPTAGTAPLDVQIDLTCTDPDGSVALYELDADGDGTFEVSQGSAISVMETYGAGSVTVSGQCTDNDGAVSNTASETVTVTQSNQSPEATITEPVDGDTIQQGTSVNFVGSASDSEDGELSGSSLVWTSDVDGNLGDGTSFSRDDLSVGSHVITLTATDSQGATGTATVSIQVEPNVGSDTEPPELITNSISPTTINVSTGPATVTVQAQFTNALSGVERGSAQFLSPSGNQITSNFNLFRISGDQFDGVYEGSTEVPQSAEAGTWTLTKLNGIDNAGNMKNFASELQGRGLPFELEVLSGSDTQPPELVTNSISPGIINVSSGPATVTVEARFTDDLSGVERGSAQFLSPSGNQITSNFGLVRISGDEFDGVYQGSTEIPQFAEAGTWTLLKLNGIDNAGNMRNFWQELEGRGLPFELEVVSASDTQPPELITSSISPDTINVSTGPASVTVQARFTDALSGVERGSAQFLSPSGNQITSNFGLVRISGDQFDGVYEGSTEIPQNAEAGTWTLIKLNGIDNAGNMRNFWQELEGRGLPFELEVVSQ